MRSIKNVVWGRMPWSLFTPRASPPHLVSELQEEIYIWKCPLPLGSTNWNIDEFDDGFFALQHVFLVVHLLFFVNFSNFFQKIWLWFPRTGAKTRKVSNSSSAAHEKSSKTF